MKELIKPNKVEDIQYELMYYCETNCTGRGGALDPGREGTANKGCSGGATNNSISDDDIILF